MDRLHAQTKQLGDHGLTELVKRNRPDDDRDEADRVGDLIDELQALRPVPTRDHHQPDRHHDPVRPEDHLRTATATRSTAESSSAGADRSMISNLRTLGLPPRRRTPSSSVFAEEHTDAEETDMPRDDNTAVPFTTSMIIDSLDAMGYHYYQRGNLVSFTINDDGPERTPLMFVNAGADGDLGDGRFACFDLIVFLPEMYHWEHWPKVLSLVNEWNCTHRFPAARLRFDDAGETANVTAEQHLGVGAGIHASLVEEAIFGVLAGTSMLRCFLAERLIPVDRAAGPHAEGGDESEAVLRAEFDELLQGLDIDRETP